MHHYEIAFAGQPLHGYPVEDVKANLMRLLQCDATRIESLFSGRRIVLKHNLDQDSVEKYRIALEQAGAQVEVVTSEATKPAPSLPHDGYMAAFAHVIAPNFKLAPLGSDLLAPEPTKEAPSLDLSSYSLAPVGSDLGQAPRAAVLNISQTSYLQMEN